MQSEENVALQGASRPRAHNSDRSREESRGRGKRPGMDYRRSEISKRDLECQQGVEGTGLCAPGKASTLSPSPSENDGEVHRRTRRVLSSP